jgi:PIN domain nuclease of toxin-antitoxin system
VIVLDTHVLIWWVSGAQELSPAAARAIEDEQKHDGRILISTISIWEIAMLVQRERLVLAFDLDAWLLALKSIDTLEFAPLSPRVAVQAATLPGEFHKDPADRFIVALAREQGVSLVTADQKIQRYPHVRWVW